MFKKIISKYKYQIFLTVIVGILFWVNYKSGTYLTGWDNLQTELNPGLAVKRAFFSVWEEYQSFGLTAGMAHAADLPRAVFLWFVSFILPQNMIRYFYHFLMLLIGGIGLFELIKGMVPNQSGDKQNNGTMKPWNNDFFAFFGALFYILNLGTVQIFYLPYEAFSTFFAFLPWGIWIFSKILNNQTIEQSSNWKLFFLINLLGTPSFYTQQLFVVYMLVLGCVTLGQLIKDSGRASLARMTKAFIFLFIINSFWLLPQFYFLKTNSKVVTEAKNNTLSTENVFYQNYEKGTLNNFLRLEGFYLDLKGKENTYLFAPWKDHFNGVFGILQYIFAGLMILGVITTLVRKIKNTLLDSSLTLGMTTLLLLCGTGLLLATPPFSWINEIIRNIPVINQIFRSPFTKFIIPYSLIYSFFVAMGIKTLVLNRPQHSDRFILNTKYFILFFAVLFYSVPSFQGYFFSPEMKVVIPDDYKSVINYFKTEDKNSRIALLPDYTFWGWFFNKWGYNGSGFIWYGIEQPIVSRTFDVWSKSSESYFWESKTAFEAEDIDKLLNVFDKYNIDYLLLDKSLIPVVSNYKALQYDRISQLLLKSPLVTTIFNGENILLYKFDHEYFSKNFISLSPSLNNISPEIDVTNDDQAFTENGLYSSDKKNAPDIVYPFLNLTSQISSSDKNWQVSEDENNFYLTTPIDFDISQYQLFENKIYKETVLINNEPTEISLNIEPKIKENSLIVRIEKKLVINFDISLNQNTDFGFTDNALSQGIGYLLSIKSTNNQGLSLSFYIVDETKKQSYLEDRLEKNKNFFIIQPRYSQGQGYTFAFQNKSFKNLTASNKLEEMSLYLFPYQALKGLKFVRKDFIKADTVYDINFETKKLNYFTYSVLLNNETMKQFNNVILYQSYSPGWIAFSDGKLLEHVKINNWANGWKISNQSGSVISTDSTDNRLPITIIFWPQYLEFLGFALLAIALFKIIKLKE